MAKKEFKNPFENVKNIFNKKHETFGDDGAVAITEKKKITGTDIKKAVGKAWSGYSFIFIFVVIFVVWMISLGNSVTWPGIMIVLRHSAVVGLMAIGMGFVIITGGIDLSVGSTLALVCVLSAKIFNDTNDLFATFMVAMCLGTGLGLVNGLLIGKAKMPAFIVTLGTMLIYRSLAQFYMRTEIGTSSILLNYTETFQNFSKFGTGNVLTIPYIGIILIAITVLFVFVANRTKYGKSVYAVGGNEKAAFLSGVKVEWVRVSVYTITGALVGFAGFLQLAMYGTVDPASVGKNNEMYAIAAAVIGGIAMAGGKGKIIGVLFGALSYTIIDKIIAALGLDALINDTIKGAILLAAVFLQLVGPMLRGVKISDQIKEITGKWLSFGKSKKALTAEGADGGGGIIYDASDDAVTEAEEAAERAVEDVLDGHASPEDAAEAVKDDSSVDKAEEHTEETPED